MTKFAAIVLLGVSAAFAAPQTCLADDNGAKPATAQPSQDKAKPHNNKSMGTTRSLHAAPPAAAAPAPTSAPRSDSSSPDDTVGGLPGAKPAVVDKQP